MLILYPETLLTSFLFLKFFGADFGVFIVSCHLQTVTVLFVSHLKVFYFFSCLISVARTCSSVLDRSGESGHPYQVPHFRGKAFSFSPLSLMLSVSLPQIEFKTSHF